LQGEDGWSIVITHAASPDKDLVYPVNPPYRFSNRQHIGPGYGDTARESVADTQRNLAFIYCPGDIVKAWADLDRVLWPYNYTEAEVQKATNDLTQIPTGTVSFEVLAADLGPDTKQPGSEERVQGLKFRATIT